MKNTKVIHLFPGAPNTPGAGVTVVQTGIDRFTVTYGLQVKKGLNYGQAAKEFGECVFHHLACEQLLDNREKKKGATNHAQTQSNPDERSQR